MIIRKGSIREAVQVSKQIPELDCPYPIEEYQKRHNQTPHLILVTEDIRGALVGFKVGYQKGSAFYS